MEIKEANQIMSLTPLDHSLLNLKSKPASLESLGLLADINQLILMMISANQEIFSEKYSMTRRRRTLLIT
jgi:hypothetical protein